MSRALVSKLPKEIYSGRDVPQAPLRSMQSFEFWEQQKEYLRNGLHKKGLDITKYHYYFLNFFCNETVDEHGNKGLLPMQYIQEDDRVFKMIEEAEAEGLAFMLMTARGYGKSAIAASIADYKYTLIPNSEIIISASYDLPATNLFNFAHASLNNKQGMLRHNQLHHKASTYVESGLKKTIDGKEVITGYRSRIRKIIYDNNAGATKGYRPDLQLFEEIGNWSGAAKLKDCYAQSRGSFYRMGKRTALVMMTGTGGNMMSGASRDARDMFSNPEAFEIYPDTLDGYNTGCFVPAYRKIWDFIDFSTGVCDEAKAKLDLEAKREKAKGDPQGYQQQVQEFPFTKEEMFLVKGSNIFNQEKIARQSVKVASDPELKKKVSRGHLHWKKKDSKIIGIEWEESSTGPFSIAEHPEKDRDGVGYKNLYIGGLDSVDQGLEDSIGHDGSCISLMIKKRFLNIQSTSNLYVAHYTERPRRASDGFENVLKLLYYYGARVNLEYSKITIVSYFRERKQYWRFLQRPVIAQSDMNSSKFVTMIGTQMNPKIKQHLQLRIQEYIEENCDQILFPELLDQLRSYTPETQTEYDMVVAMGLCEIADEDLLEVAIRKEDNPKMPMQNFGYYKDPVTGYMKKGVIPNKEDIQKELRGAPPRHVKINYYDSENRKIEYFP